MERYAGWRRRGMSARADFREGTLTNSGLSDFISNAPNAKKGCIVTHEQRNHACWRVKTGTATTVRRAPASEPKAQAASRFKRPSLKLLIAGLVALVVLIVGVARISRGLNTVSTDDAYVNSHVTFVAARVSGQVMQVLVDDNSRVRKGDVLVELDREPFRVQVAIKQAAVDVANANLIMAEANVRGLVAQVRSQRFKLTHAIEDVDDQVALIRQRVATWDQSKASLVLAQQELDRAERLLASKVVSNQTFSSVRQALAELLQSAAQLGVVPSSYNLTPKETIDEFYRAIRKATSTGFIPR